MFGQFPSKYDRLTNDSPMVGALLYKSIVCALQHDSVTTPDINNLVNKLS